MAKARAAKKQRSGRVKKVAVSAVIVILVLLGIIWVIASIGTDLRTGSGTFSSVPPSK